MSGEYKTKEKIFAPGSYVKVYESSTRGWCWLVRLTNYKGTFVGKGSNYRTKQQAEKNMMYFIEELEPLIYHYKKVNCEEDQSYYKTFISYSSSYTTKVSGFDKFLIYLRFLWCKLFHKRHKFRFHELVEPFIKHGNDYYYNIYCRKCWCIRQKKLKI